MLNGKDRLIVALDVSDGRRALELVDMLAPFTGMFKVGMELFYSGGADMVKEIKKKGGKIFLDLKMHDIPNTVSRAAGALAGLGVDMLNVHAAGGREMMRQAALAAREGAAAAGNKPPLVIAVTVLTSISQEMFNNEMGLQGKIIDRVTAWAEITREAGLDGVVSSPLEIAAIRRACGDDFIIVTPGIRPSGSVRADQKRVMTPGEAVKDGASYIVAGRPITGAEDPAAAARAITEEMDAVLEKGCVR
ncbi:orotidine 5'-phosphate decarboxylase [Desulfocucumis palustris]|uniref:Orotidine 5'-phosphate decarboxylase n=1 Tax=Desulfocucumis palustris TaxID=1898651 RepID=A0A2L2XBD6_9FIRM|nr:orotidine-5'-phosphate decarboxylase [Desulfocucumis palustris]GBF32993.1 orotidine 5'-phosphate decarboxylase [Desulfocucumis palustris]